MPLNRLCASCRNILAEEGEEGLQEDTQYPVEEDLPDDVHICVTCAHKERLNNKIKEFLPFMNTFSDLVNNSVYDHDDIISDALVACFFRQHRYLQQEMIILLKKIFAKIGEQSGSAMYEDPRNQWALKWCLEVSKTEVIISHT